MIRIQTFGGLSVRGEDGRPLAGSAAQPRRMAVLAVLARAGDRGITRERLVALLWPDAGEERGRNNLAQALYALRRDLGADDAIAGTKELRLDAERVASDVGEFATAVTRGQHAQAATLYAGPFLDGFHVPGAAEFARWMDDERQALAHDHARVLEALARAADAAGDASAATGWWRKLAAADPLNARVTVGLMGALAAAGDPAGALQHARIYEALLEQELDLPPDREVVRLADRLRREATAGTGGGTAALQSRALPPTVVAPPAVAAPAVAAPGPLLIDAPPDAPPATPSPTAAALDGARTAAAAPADAPAAAPATEPAASTHDTPAEARPRIPHAAPRRLRRAGVAALVVAALAGAAAVAGLRGRAGRGQPPAAPVAAAVPVVAVGHIAGYELGARAAGLTAPLADLLATNLARVPGLRVVSAGRMLELTSRGGLADTSAGTLTTAARAAGATELVDGTLYGRPGGLLRLDLRRVDLATGAIVDVRTVEGPDLFALVDSGTAHLASHLGASAPAGSVADVTTRSLAAYRLYVEGLRRYYALDEPGAQRLLAAAAAEDSTFAMAAYYWAVVTPDLAQATARMARAVRLSSSASERERLIIRAGWALRFSAPELSAIADSLATKYPDEVEGHYYRGTALVMTQDYQAALPHLRQAMNMDSLALGGAGTARGVCIGCEARANLIFAYEAMDSLSAAEREVRDWTRTAPASSGAWLSLSSVLDARGRPAEALAALDSARRRDGGGGVGVQNALALHWIRVGEFARAEEMLRVRVGSGTPADQAEALWYLAIAHREQGQIGEALDLAHRYRATDSSASVEPSAVSASALLEAVVLDEVGRHGEAAALFDSISRWRVPGLAPSQYARNRAWAMTHAANALAAAGDTGGLLARADTVAAYGARSGLGRDRRLAHHVRGLALAARGSDAAAAAEFRASIRTPTMGYTRSNAELARALLRLGRPAEAVAVLQPALRGAIDGTNLYVSRTELYDLLARAWDAASAPDSAALHYAQVARAWGAGDAPFQARAAAAEARRAAMAGKGARR